MTPTPSRPVRTRELHLDRLLGRQVRTRSNRRAGRLQEFRAEVHGTNCLITEVVLGAGGLLERLGVAVKLLFGRATGGYVARWDQLDLTDEKHPRLTCDLDELRRL